MNQPKKPAPGNSTQGSPHPEKGAGVKPGLPGYEQSKTLETTERDGRTSHDRDGNQEQPPTPDKGR